MKKLFLYKLIPFDIKMIRYNPKTWFSSILAFRRSDTVLIIWKEILYIFLFTLGLTFWN